MAQINLQAPDIRELKPHITVFGVGGAGGNAVNNMIDSGLQGVEFVVANTDAQALASSRASRIVQMGVAVTEGLGAGSQPDVGRAAAEEVIDEIRDQLSGAHMVFITAGMGGGTGTGAAPVIARAAREMGILTVGVVTKPFQFEGSRRMKLAEAGIQELQSNVDTLIVIPNQNLFRVANERTTFADAFAMADQVLYSGVACITDLMVKEGLINLDFADVRAIMRGMGKAMMGTGEASGDNRALQAAEAAIANPLLDDVSMKGARGLLISITGGPDLTLYEVDEAATRIREEVDSEANIILGATFDETLEGVIRVSVVATGIDHELAAAALEVSATEQRIAEVAERLRAEARARATQQGQAPATTTVVPQVPAQRAAAPAETAAPAARPAAEAPSAQVAAEPETHVPAPAAAPVVQAHAAPQPAPQPATHAAAPAPVHAPSPAVTAAERAVAEAMAGLAVERTPAPQPEPEASHDDIFVPPQAERVHRAPRMPRVDELPMPAQNQLRARGPQPEAEQKRGLLHRLATVGFGRREDAPAQPHGQVPGQAPGQQHAQPAPQAQAPAARQPAPAPRPAQPAAQAPAQPQQPQQPGMSPVHAEYTKRPAAPQGYRPAQGNLDPHGRAPAQPRPLDDDQLEIPAFLRRQAN
ncbi:cell division protein FtsZ [Salinarimonas rosea]|uniref:cell division protein FtsZ n=1 Tax=Salinarimonas rosea TaxID=552063 RepID=UPI0003F6928C|nr:cell division protein FtsZ [Salinarimonas rosea]